MAGLSWPMCLNVSAGMVLVALLLIYVGSFHFPIDQLKTQKESVEDFFDYVVAIKN